MRHLKRTWPEAGAQKEGVRCTPPSAYDEEGAALPSQPCRPDAPVTMTVRMRVLRRARMTAAVWGFSRFRNTSSPRRFSSLSTASLQGAQTWVRGHELAPAPNPNPGQGRLPRARPAESPPAAQSPGRSPPRQLLSGLQAGRDGQRLAGEGHDAVAGGRVVLQRLGEVWGHCRGQAGVTGTRRWGPGRRRGAHPILGRGPPPSPVLGLQRPATSSGEPLT